MRIENEGVRKADNRGPRKVEDFLGKRSGPVAVSNRSGSPDKGENVGYTGRQTEAVSEGRRDVIIAPSVLAADFMDLGAQIARIEEGGAKWLHFDVMDGVFVPNISLGVPVLASINKKSDIVLDVHLMITEPIRYINEFRAAGADIITFHLEACDNVEDTIRAVKSSGAKAGISIKPGTHVNEIFKYIDRVDMVLIMTVEPGFGGQSFMVDMMDKVSKIRKYIDENKLDVYLQVDGGITAETIKPAAEAGADVFVAGTSVFGADDISESVKKLIDIAVKG